MYEELEAVLTVAEAAALWGIPRDTIKTAVRRGYFPSGSVRKSGDAVLIHRKALEQLYGPPPSQTQGDSSPVEADLVPIRSVLKTVGANSVRDVLARRDELPPGTIRKRGRVWYVRRDLLPELAKLTTSQRSE